MINITPDTSKLCAKSCHGNHALHHGPQVIEAGLFSGIEKEIKKLHPMEQATFQELAKLPKVKLCSSI